MMRCGILAWTIELHPDAAKHLRALAWSDKPTAKRVTEQVTEVGKADDPRYRGSGLRGPLAGLWRYRVGDWRNVAETQDSAMIIVALDIDHRSRVYRESIRAGERLSG
jgi:mRNA interferase RelE/StbE